jgi:predicted nucleic acid-binding protein
VIVVADTGPLRYLILIDCVHVLPSLYGRVLVPPAVVTELNREQTPPLVRQWISDRPTWLEVVAPQHVPSSLRDVLGPGECEAISLAEEFAVDALLIDDREGRREAEKRKLAVLGTLRVLADAAEHASIDLREAFDRLRLTNFRADEQLLQRLLALEAERRQR